VIQLSAISVTDIKGASNDSGVVEKSIFIVFGYCIFATFRRKASVIWRNVGYIVFRRICVNAKIRDLEVQRYRGSKPTSAEPR